MGSGLAEVKYIQLLDKKRDNNVQQHRTSSRGKQKNRYEKIREKLRGGEKI